MVNMEVSASLKKTSWINTLLIVGFPAALMTPLLCYLNAHVPLYIFYDYAAFNFPHVLTGFVIIYLVQKEHKKQPLLYIAAPAAIFAAIIVFFALGYSNEAERVRLYAGTLHVLLQDYFILWFYKLVSRETSRTDKILDTLAIAVGYIFLMLRFFSQFQAQGEIILSFYIRRYVYHVTRIFIIIIIVFIIRQVYLYLRWRKFAVLKTLLVLMVFASYYLPAISDRNVMLSNRATITVHNIQYMAWAWLYYQYKFKGKITEGAGFVSYLSQPAHLGLYLLFIYAVSLVFNFSFVFVFGQHHWPPVVAALAGVHAFTEIVFWRLLQFKILFNFR
jgi:hypothetical protein